MIDYSIKLKNDVYRVSIQGHADSLGPVFAEFNQACGLVSLLGETCALALSERGKGFELIERKAGSLKFIADYNDVSAALIFALAHGLAAIRCSFPKHVREVQ